MMASKIMIKAPANEVENMLSEYEDIEIFESKRKNWTLAEDYTYLQFVGWEISNWIELADGHELIYAYYDENINAEFFHIKDGVCVRAYQEYDGEIDIDEGNDPEISISDSSDVDIYIYENMN